VFCKNCGSEYDIQDTFCQHCGKKLDKIVDDNSSKRIDSTIKDTIDGNNKEDAQVDAEEYNSFNNSVCPKCGQHECTPIVQSTDSKMFNSVSGIIGMLVLGPIGFICGFFGNDKSSTQSWWYCNNCGSKHMSKEDALEVLKKRSSRLCWASAVVGLLGALLTYIIGMKIFVFVICLYITYCAWKESEPGLNNQVGFQIELICEKASFTADTIIGMGAMVTMFFIGILLPKLIF